MARDNVLPICYFLVLGVVPATLLIIGAVMYQPDVIVQKEGIITKIEKHISILFVPPAFSIITTKYHYIIDSQDEQYVYESSDKNLAEVSDSVIITISKYFGVIEMKKVVNIKDVDMNG